MTLHIVLTGGVASGKTAVSQYFEELGIRVIDADIIAREVVAVGSVGLNEITKHFGVSVLQDDGTLNRRALRDIVFQDDEQLNWLNQLLHPLIRERMQQLRKVAESCDELYTISAIPLYVETIHGTAEAENYYRVLVVDVDEETQMERLIQRDNTSSEKARSLIDSQATRDDRLAVADDVIINNSNLQSLKQQVIKLDKQYRSLARS